MAEKACHAVVCATQFGLTQALGSTTSIGATVKVKELISQLEKLDPNLDVYCASDDEIPLVKDRAVIAFPVDDPSEVRVKLYRDADGVLCVQACGSDDGYRIAVLNISLDQR